MIRVVLLSGKAYGKAVTSIRSDVDGQTLADEGNVVIYADDVLDIESQLGLKVEMV